MSSKFGIWIQSKLDQITDRATPGDWEAMEELINAHPSLSPSPWYKTTWGFSTIVASGVLIVGLTSWTLFSTSEESNAQISDETPQIEQVEDIAVESPASTTFEAETIEQTQPVQELEPAEPSVIASNEPTRTQVSQPSIVQTSNSEESSSISESSSPSGDVAQTELIASSELEQPSDRSIADEPSVDEFQEAHEESNPTALAAATHSTDRGTTNTSSTPAGNSSSTQPSSSSSFDGGSSNSNSDMGTPSASTTGTPSLASATDNNTNSGASPTSSENTNSNAAGSSTSSMSNAIIRDVPSNELRFAVSAYADYNLDGLTAPQGEMTQRAQFINPVGMGVELEAIYNGWTFNTGFMSHREEATYTSNSSYTDTSTAAVYWYEIDTSYSTSYDSIWVDTGGGQGYWNVDTVVEVNYSERIAERLDTLIITTNSQSTVEAIGYRYSVPFLIGKQWEFNNWRVGAQVGPILTIRSTSWFYDGVFNRTDYTNSLDLMLRAEVGYDITQHFNVFGRVGVRTNMYRVASLRQNAWSQPAVPVSVGLRYIF